MSDIYHLVKFGKKASGVNPYGQKDAFYLANANMGYGKRIYEGAGDKFGHVEMDTSYFQIYMPHLVDHSHIDENVVQDLAGYLQQQITNKMDPDTITLYEVTVSDDTKSFNINRQMEHTNAIVGAVSGRSDVFIITSDTATLSTKAKGDDQATYRTALDFKNRQINGQG